MAAPKGHQKYGGRVKGTPNKKTQSLMNMCEDKGFNPFEALIEMAKDGVHKFDATKELCQYLYPKRKSLEHSGSFSPELLDAAENVLNLTKEQQIELLQEELNKLKGDK